MVRGRLVATERAQDECECDVNWAAEIHVRLWSDYCAYHNLEDHGSPRRPTKLSLRCDTPERTRTVVGEQIESTAEGRAISWTVAQIFKDHSTRAGIDVFTVRVDETEGGTPRV
jgi:hypothetical protein